MASGSKVTLRGGFSPGQRVTLFKRNGSAGFVKAQCGAPLGRAQVDKDGVVEFTVDEAGLYWIAGQNDAGEWRGVAMSTRPARPVVAGVQKHSPAKVREILKATQPFQVPSNVVVGARSTKSTRPEMRTMGGQKFASAATGHPSELPEQAPHGRIEDAGDVPLQSYTVTGEAIPAVNDDGSPILPEKPASKPRVRKPAAKKPARKRARKPESAE